MVMISYKMFNPNSLFRVQRLQPDRVIPPIRSHHVHNNTNIMLPTHKNDMLTVLCCPRETNAKSGCRVFFVIFPKYRFVDHLFVISFKHYFSSFILHVRFIFTSRVGSRRTIILNYMIFICLYLPINIIVFFTRQHANQNNLVQ